jgi:hypothetical protein
MKSALFAKAGLFLISGLAQAEDSLSQASLSEVALFNRCYSHLTRLRLPKSHPLLTQVKLGSKTAAQACAETLSKAQLGEDGRPVASSDPESIAILNNFYQFHRLWFDNASLRILLLTRSHRYCTTTSPSPLSTSLVFSFTRQRLTARSSLETIQFAGFALQARTSSITTEVPAYSGFRSLTLQRGSSAEVYKESLRMLRETRHGSLTVVRA